MEKTVYLMRGLPGCGKSHKARRLAGADGIVLETDQYFYTEVGDDPASYDYSEGLLPAAREWNLARFRAAIAREISPIVVDRGNGLNRETWEYAAYAVQRGYQVALAEPDSPWWQELRVLLKYQQHVDGKLLDAWAKQLADATRETHRVPVATIRHWMSRWRHDLTVEDIVTYEELPEST
ncbi:MAG: AAA family ATPase [Planctomycetota bacterium]